MEVREVRCRRRESGRCPQFAPVGTHSPSWRDWLSSVFSDGEEPFLEFSI